jgi:LacI family transcriptional regulator
VVRSEQIVASIRQELLEGRFGAKDERFMTVRELAERFDVSLTTAHKAIGQLKAEGLLVADSTNRARISAKAARIAAASQQGGPRRLGLMVTNIASPFFSSLCRYVQQFAAALNYQVLVASSDYDFQREQKTIESFLEIGVDGLLICPGLTDESVALYRSLLSQGTRLVFVSRRVEEVEADFVVAHNFVGGASVAGHFLSMGYDSFGYLAFGPRLKHDVRLSGFRSALTEEGMQLDNRFVVDGGGRDIANGYQAMGQLMEARQRPRAVFAFSDLLAIGALQYCQEHGIAVPGKVAVAGFDNLPESRVTHPPLTTVDYGVEAMARLAVQSLVDRIHQPQEHLPARVLLEPRLIVRRSTDPQARDPRRSSTSHTEFYEV